MTLGKALIQSTVPLTVLAAVATILALGPGEAGIREALRATARISLIAFVLAFIARPLHQLSPSAFSAWTLRHRRLIGVCFGLSLSAHILLIVWLYIEQHPEWPDIIGPLDVAIGGPGLLLVIAMTITSFQFARRRMSATAWKRLHTSGLYLVWFIFTACLIDSYIEKSPPKPGWHYTPLILLLLLALAIRLAAALKLGRGAKGAL